MEFCPLNDNIILAVVAFNKIFAFQPLEKLLDPFHPQIAWILIAGLKGPTQTAQCLW